MKTLAILITSGIILAAQPGFAKNSDMSIPVDSRIKILTYDANDIFTIPTKYGYQTSIVFADGEDIQTVSVGDRSLWQIIPAGHRIFIRPLNDDLSTNMTVITNAREYHFDIKSITGDKTAAVYVAQFRYPEDKRDAEPQEAPPPIVAAAPPPKPVAVNDIPAAPVIVTSNNVSIPPLDTQRTQSPNYDYTYTGPDEIAPARVYDDGKNTYIEYAQKPKAPPIPLMVNADGKQVAAKYTRKNNIITITTIAAHWILKSPTGEIHVYNELLASH